MQLSSFRSYWFCFLSGLEDVINGELLIIEFFPEFTIIEVLFKGFLIFSTDDN